MQSALATKKLAKERFQFDPALFCRLCPGLFDGVALSIIQFRLQRGT